jgi:hypothetical protein
MTGELKREHLGGRRGCRPGGGSRRGPGCWYTVSMPPCSCLILANAVTGHEYSNAELKKCSGYVMQDDLLNANLTGESPRPVLAQEPPHMHYVGTRLAGPPKGATPEASGAR